MISLEELDRRLTSIELRNNKVEKDKKWETSWTRRGLLMFFTYTSIGLYLMAIGVENFWIHAVVPTIGFFLSTLTLPYFKKIWLSQNSKPR